MLGALDLSFLVISILITVAIGVYHSIIGRKATTTEYMLGGRSMSPLPLAMSMTMGTISSVTMMANIGEVYAYGTQLWMMDVGIALGMVVVAQYFIPIFFPLKMISVYQYLEERFTFKVVRYSAVFINLLGAFAFLGFLLFPASLFLEQFTGLSKTTNVIIMGLICGIYSSLGGVKAVVHTDVVQSLVMLVGILAMMIQCIVSVGGISKGWNTAYERDRIEFFNVDFNPYQRHSLWLTICNGFFFSLSTFGVTQSQIQRTFSTGTVKYSKRVMFYSIFGMLVFKSLINFTGVMVTAFYVDCNPIGKYPNIIVVIKYVEHELTKIPGLTGLFLASIYAAVLSSVSTQVNSITALIWEDILKHSSCFSNWSDTKITVMQKIIVFFCSIFGILACLIIFAIDQSLFTLLYKLTGAISGPMVGLFLMGLYLPWIRGKSAAFGLLIAMVLSFWMVVGQIVYETDPPYLPVPEENCYPKNRNSSRGLIEVTTQLSNDYTSTDKPASNITEYIENDTATFLGSHPLYGLSYCLNFLWGTVTAMVIASIASLFTGWNTQDTVKESLIAPISWKIFTKLGSPSYAPPVPKLWRVVQQKKNSYFTDEVANKNVHREGSYRKSTYTDQEETMAMNEV